MRLAAVVLPPPEGPDQGHGLSRLRREGDMGEGGGLRAVVGEAHIPNSTRLWGFLGMGGAFFSVGASMTWSMRARAVPASMMPEAANMILASAVEMMAENTA